MDKVITGVRHLTRSTGTNCTLLWTVQCLPVPMPGSLPPVEWSKSLAVSLKLFPLVRPSQCSETALYRVIQGSGASKGTECMILVPRRPFLKPVESCLDVLDG